jgi:predicted transcriptional regulator
VGAAGYTVAVNLSSRIEYFFVFLRRFKLLLTSLKAKKSIRNNRGHLDIVRDILSAVSIKTRKTKIMYQANLSYTQVQKYLQDLLERDLLNHDGTSFYLITKKGLQFLKLYDEHADLCKRLEEQMNQYNREEVLLDQMCSNRDFDCDAKNMRNHALES